MFRFSLVLIATALFLAASYPASYLGLCTKTYITPDDGCRIRVYRTEFEAAIFEPLSLTETVITNFQIETRYSTP